jgi:hypothetical protein
LHWAAGCLEDRFHLQHKALEQAQACKNTQPTASPLIKRHIDAAIPTAADLAPMRSNTGYHDQASII